jgi:hypothetical protein
MINDLTSYTGGSNDGWGDAADEAGERVVRGTLLKFSDWNWTAGKEGRTIEKGTELIALATAAAWVKWVDGKPAQYEMRPLGRALVGRESLGDLDEDSWPAGPDGRPRDPWQNTRFVHLVDPKTAEAFTFSTSSWGGRECVTGLGDQVQRMRCARPGAVPVVALDAAPMQTKYGRKSKPVLRIVGWKGGAIDEPQQLIEANPARGRDMDDEIPF